MNFTDLYSLLNFVFCLNLIEDDIILDVNAFYCGGILASDCDSGEFSIPGYISNIFFKFNNFSLYLSFGEIYNLNGSRVMIFLLKLFVGHRYPVVALG